MEQQSTNTAPVAFRLISNHSPSGDMTRYAIEQNRTEATANRIENLARALFCLLKQIDKYMKTIPKSLELKYPRLYAK